MKLNERIDKTLRWLGIAPHLNGYRYLSDAIEMTLNDAEYLHSMTKRLYPDIARKYGVSDGAAERSIRHAIRYAWQHTPLDVLHKAFGNTCSTRSDVPTNSLFLATVVLLIKNEYKIF